MGSSQRAAVKGHEEDLGVDVLLRAPGRSWQAACGQEGHWL